MKTNLKVSLACGLAALLVSMGASAEVTLGADAELDITSSKGNSLDNGGRIKLSASAEEKGANYFIKGVAQPLIYFNKDSNGGDRIGYDDVFLQFGQNAWDVQLGSFEGIDLMPAGKDTYVAAAANSIGHYSAGDVRGRVNNKLHTAVHLKPNDATTLEMGVMVDRNDDSYDKYVGLRPAVVYNAGMATVRAGFESGKTTDFDGTSSTDKGFGVSAGFDVAGGTLNAGVARLDKDGAANKKTTMKLNYTQGPWGVGLMNSKQGDDKLTDLYGAYTMPLLGSDKATVTFAAGTSKATTDGVDTKDNGARVRFNYTF